MSFLRECATWLDEGMPAADVLRRMRERYSTPDCMKVKTCLVRKLCKHDPAYRTALEEQLAQLSDVHERERVRALIERATSASRCRTGDDVADAILAQLPPSLPRNVRDLHVTTEEFRACKKNARRARLEKNSEKRVVDGVLLLETSRETLRTASTVAELALALMLLTGRRQCELLSGHSVFSADPDCAYAAIFRGQAKRKSSDCAYRIPLLYDYESVHAAYERLRAMQGQETLTRERTSRKYQSLLSRVLTHDETFQAVGRVHGLRGVYACMALRAFTWAGRSDSFVTMCILGHCDLDESLVYTTFDIGTAFVDRYGASLGEGPLTDPAP